MKLMLCVALLSCVLLAVSGDHGGRRVHQLRGRARGNHQQQHQQQQQQRFVVPHPIPARSNPPVPQRFQPRAHPIPVPHQAQRHGRTINFEGATFDNNSPDELGNYEYTVSTADGAFRRENGYVKNLGRDGEENNEIRGEVSYISPDGTPISYTYVANEFGFQVEGEHIPKLG